MKKLISICAILMLAGCATYPTIPPATKFKYVSYFAFVAKHSDKSIDLYYYNEQDQCDFARQNEIANDAGVKTDCTLVTEKVRDDTFDMSKAMPQ